MMIACSNCPVIFKVKVGDNWCPGCGTRAVIPPPRSEIKWSVIRELFRLILVILTVLALWHIALPELRDYSTTHNLHKLR